MQTGVRAPKIYIFFLPPHCFGLIHFIISSVPCTADQIQIGNQVRYLRQILGISVQCTLYADKSVIELFVGNIQKDNYCEYVFYDIATKL